MEARYTPQYPADNKAEPVLQQLPRQSGAIPETSGYGVMGAFRQRHGHRSRQQNAKKIERSIRIDGLVPTGRKAGCQPKTILQKKEDYHA
jgi:hypothetical protein